jgi:hypothetical protein
MRSAASSLVLVTALVLACSSNDDPDDDDPGGSAGTAGKDSGGSDSGGKSGSGGKAGGSAGKGGSSAGKGGGNSAGSGGDMPAPELRGPCKDGTRLGGFDATIEDDYTTIGGKVLNRFVRSTILTEVESDADCSLIKAANPYCSPSCGSGKVCSSEQECVEAALSQSVGTVDISGFLKPVNMTPVVPGNNYFVPGADDFPHPAFEPGAAVVLAAAGGDLPGFTLNGVGVAPLALDETDFELARGKPFKISWTAGDVAAARVRVTLRVDQHGNSPVTMTCLSPDDGELEIAAKLVDALLDAGISGFPSGNVYRETVDSVELDAGCVELDVGAHEQRALKVAGYVPCKKQADCPEGTTCNVALERCEEAPQ